MKLRRYIMKNVISLTFLVLMGPSFMGGLVKTQYHSNENTRSQNDLLKDEESELAEAIAQELKYKDRHTKIIECPDEGLMRLVAAFKVERT